MRLPRLRATLGFVALCLLGSSAWLVDAYLPPELSPAAAQIVRNALLAILFFAISLRGKSNRQSALWAVLLVTLPAGMFYLASAYLSTLLPTLLLTLVPAIVVFFEAQSEATFGSVESPLRLLLPALAGIGGAALLVPFSLPASPAGAACLLAELLGAVAVGYASLRLKKKPQVGSFGRLAAIVSSANLLMALPFCHGLGFETSSLVRESVIALLIQGPGLLLTLYLVRVLQPAAFASRYLFVPMLAVVEGWVMLKPGFSWTLFAGLLLLGGGATILFLSADSTPASSSGSHTLD